MIGQISGKVTLVNKIDGSICILTNSGVGYAVFVGTNFALNLTVESEISLFVETVVKEDSITLYGFENYEKQVWFKSFLKVSGVGTKMAMNIVDTFAIESIVNAIVVQNALFFQSVSGLGEKVSQRIISELKKEPAKNIKTIGTTICSGAVSVNYIQVENVEKSSKAEKPKNIAEKKSCTNINDVVSALTNLGFDYNKSYSAAKNAVENSKTLEDAIVFALKKINEN